VSTQAISIALSMATLLVVGAAAVAAIIQLRHLRASNQLNALLGIMSQWNLPPVQAALSELRALPEKMNEPTYVQALRTPGSLDRAHFPEFLALDLWEQIGTYSKYGLIDENILLDIVSAQVANAWRLAEPAIAVVRARTGQSAFENFEYLAVRADLWGRRYPNGTYPANQPHMTDLKN
jgi:hypothetical protein